MSVLIFHRTIVSMVYYGLSLNSSKMGGNDFVNFAISGAVELPGAIFSQLTLAKTGRRWTLFASMVIAGAALLCLLAVPTGKMGFSHIRLIC